MADHGHVDAKEGGRIVCPGDWIITEIDGECYPCRPDIFAATYEPADAPDAPDAALAYRAVLANVQMALSAACRDDRFGYVLLEARTQAALLGCVDAQLLAHGLPPFARPTAPLPPPPLSDAM